MDYCPSQQTVALICYRKGWMFEIKSTHLGILSLLLATLSISITNSGVWKTRTTFRWISTKNNFFWHRAGSSPFNGAGSTFGKLHLWRKLRHHISRDWVPSWKLGGEITWRWWCPPHHDTMRHPWGKWKCFIWKCKTKSSHHYRCWILVKKKSQITTPENFWQISSTPSQFDHIGLMWQITVEKYTAILRVIINVRTHRCHPQHPQHPPHPQPPQGPT